MTKQTKTTKQSTELVVVDEARVAALRDLSGAKESTTLDWPPKIKINRVPYDVNENKLPTGKFMITVNEVTHFLDSVDMIVMAKGTQFLRFANKKLVGKTMIENDFNPEYKDSLGGTRLGRVSGMKPEEMTQAQKDAKFYFYMFGVADISGATNAAGDRLYEANVAIWTPVSLAFKGKKSVDKQNEFRGLKERKEAYFDFITVLDKPFKAGTLETDGSAYYDFNFSRGDDVVLTNELLDSIEAVKALIEIENKSIYKSYLDAQSKSEGSVEASYTDLDLAEEEEDAE